MALYPWIGEIKRKGKNLNGILHLMQLFTFYTVSILRYFLFVAFSSSLPLFLFTQFLYIHFSKEPFDLTIDLPIDFFGCRHRQYSYKSVAFRKNN